MYPQKPSELVPLSVGNPIGHVTPSSSPSFLSLSSTSGFVMGGVLQRLLLLQVVELFGCTCGLPHMGDKRFSPIPKQTKLQKKSGFRNMEVNVGNQSWVHWSMHLAKYIHMKNTGKDVTHCTHVLLTQHANHLRNNAMKR